MKTEPSSHLPCSVIGHKRKSHVLMHKELIESATRGRLSLINSMEEGCIQSI